MYSFSIRFSKTSEAVKDGWGGGQGQMPGSGGVYLGYLTVALCNGPPCSGQERSIVWGESLSETLIAWNVVKVENLPFKALPDPSPGSPSTSGFLPLSWEVGREMTGAGFSPFCVWIFGAALGGIIEINQARASQPPLQQNPQPLHDKTSCCR